MPLFLTILSQKGEQGKTSTVVNLAAAMAQNGRHGTVVDLDAQQIDALKFAGSLPGVAFVSQLPATTPSGDFVLVDTSPVINPQTIAALKQSAVVIIPVTPLGLSLMALARTFETIAVVRQQQPDLKALVVFTQTDRKAFTEGVMTATRALSEWPVAQTTIPHRLMDFERAVSARVPVVCHARKSVGALAYRQLLEEIEEYAKP